VIAAADGSSFCSVRDDRRPIAALVRGAPAAARERDVLCYLAEAERAVFRPSTLPVPMRLRSPRPPATVVARACRLIAQAE